MIFKVESPEERKATFSSFLENLKTKKAKFKKLWKEGFFSAYELQIDQILFTTEKKREVYLELPQVKKVFDVLSTFLEHVDSQDDTGFVRMWRSAFLLEYEKEIQEWI